MKINAQSLIEFAVILMVVTAIAIFSLQIISNRINSSSERKADIEEVIQATTSSIEEANCTKMGLSWDKQNGVCEAK